MKAEPSHNIIYIAGVQYGYQAGLRMRRKEGMAAIVIMANVQNKVAIHSAERHVNFGADDWQAETPYGRID